MATDVKPRVTQSQADSLEVASLIAQAKKVADPDLRRYVLERADRVRHQIPEQHGVVEWAVDMIRDPRGR